MTQVQIQEIYSIVAKGYITFVQIQVKNQVNEI